MKNEKLIYAVRNIDDDLICEAMRRRIAEPESAVEGVRAVYISGRKKGQAWKNAAAAVILLAVTGGAIFIVNYNGGIQDQLPSASEKSGTPTDKADLTGDETKGVVFSGPAEEVKEIVPLKVVQLKNGCEHKCQAVYVNSYPKIPQPKFDEQYFTPMTTLELLEYYDFHESISLRLGDIFTEITDENTRHGIYTYPDGSVYDINTFSFEFSNPGGDIAKRITITLSKKTTFAAEYFNYYEKEGLDPSCSHNYFIDKEMDTVYGIFQAKETTFFVSGKITEMTDDSEKIADVRNYLANYLDNSDRYNPSVLEIFNTTWYQLGHSFRYYYNEVKNEWYEKMPIEMGIFE